VKLRFLVVSAIGSVAAFVAAACWLYSATIQVPDNIDAIMQELHRIGRWNSAAAVASCVAALLGCLAFILNVLDQVGD
jgi:hypothetical protein